MKRVPTFRLAQWGQKHLLYLPLYVALRMAERERLFLDMDYAGNDDAVYNRITSGKADFGIGDPLLTATHPHKKNPVACIATIVQRAALFGITNNPAIPELKSIDDLVQLRIGSFPKPSTTYCLMADLKRRHKRLLKKMQIIEAPIGKQALLLAHDQADVILELEPMVSLAESKGLRVVLPMAEFYGPAVFTGVMVAESFIHSHTHIVRRFCNLLAMALGVCNHDTAQALDIAELEFPDYPRALLEKALLRLRSYDVWPPNTNINEAAWRNALRVRRNLKD